MRKEFLDIEQIFFAVEMQCAECMFNVSERKLYLLRSVKKFQFNKFECDFQVCYRENIFVSKFN